MISKTSYTLAQIVAASLCIAPSAASATSPPTFSSYRPIVTLSMLGSNVSATALLAATSAAAAQARTRGCVLPAFDAAGGCILPAIDAPPPVAVAVPPPPAPFAPVIYPAAVQVASNNFLFPLIGGLAALVALLALSEGGKPRGNGFGRPPISPD